MFGVWSRSPAGIFSALDLLPVMISGGGRVLSSAGLPSYIMWGGGRVCCLYQVGRLRGSAAVGSARRWWSCRGSAVAVVYISGGVDILRRFPALLSSAGCRWWGLCRSSPALSSGVGWMICGGSRRLSLSPSAASLRLSGAFLPAGVLCYRGTVCGCPAGCVGLVGVNPRGAYMLGYRQAYHALLYIMHN